MTESGLVRCVGAVVHDPAGRLLLVRRGTEPERGRWSVPGGKVEAGESDAQALRRELAEETALTVTVGARCGTVRKDPYLIVDYFCTARPGVARAGDDADAVRFVDAAELDRMAAAGTLVSGLADTLRGWDALPRA